MDRFVILLNNERDEFTQCYKGLFLTVYLGGITLCIFWLRYWMGPLLTIINKQQARPEMSSLSQWENSAWNVVFDHSVRWTAISFCIAMLEIGIFSMGVALWPIFKACIGKHATMSKHPSTVYRRFARAHLNMQFATMCSFYSSWFCSSLSSFGVYIFSLYHCASLYPSLSIA